MRGSMRRSRGGEGGLVACIIKTHGWVDWDVIGSDSAGILRMERPGLERKVVSCRGCRLGPSLVRSHLGETIRPPVHMSTGAEVSPGDDRGIVLSRNVQWLLEARRSLGQLGSIRSIKFCIGWCNKTQVTMGRHEVRGISIFHVPATDVCGSM